MSSFIAALWTRNTSHDQTHCRKSQDAKYYEMEHAVEQCQTRVNNRIHDLSPTNAFQAIFAAPEYYFTGFGNVRVPMPEQDKVTLEHRLLQLSQRFPKILIVPGTVYYSKPLTLPVNSRKLDRQTGQVVQTTGPKHRQQKTIDKLTQVGFRELNQGIQNTLGGALVFDDGCVGLGNLSGRPVPSIMDKQDAIQNGNPRILRNTTYLYLNGTRYGKYDKQSDYHESLLAPDQMVFVPGTKDECPEIGGHRFGVEICADHANRKLKSRSLVGLDFHLVVSDHVINSPSAMAMAEYGYFLHASSAATETRVTYRNDAGTLIELTHDNNYRFDSRSQAGGTLDFWCLPLPNDMRTAEAARQAEAARKAEAARQATARTQQAGLNRARQRK